MHVRRIAFGDEELGYPPAGNRGGTRAGDWVDIRLNRTVVLT